MYYLFGTDYTSVAKHSNLVVGISGKLFDFAHGICQSHQTGAFPEPNILATIAFRPDTGTKRFVIFKQTLEMQGLWT